ncbi:MAG: suppressor of fused domain protein, partial [Pirellula sp.]
LGWGITVHFAEAFPDFVQKYAKTALYITLPNNFPETFRQIKCGEIVGTIYHAIFITETEHLYKLKFGAEVLEDLFAKHNPDVFDLNRKTCI